MSQPDLSPLAVYQARVASGALSPDDGQLAAITRLDRLWHELAAHAVAAR
ncbi:cell division protein ZapE, partial [Endobacter medicaginis]|nr:cell division protein ZapE [Endobacter medicaginis]